MRIKKGKHVKPFVLIDEDLCFNRELSIGARLVYVALKTLKPDRDINLKIFAQKMGIGITSLDKYKKELTDAGLIMVHQIRPRQFNLYIGSSHQPAENVKEYWDSKEKAEGGVM